MTPGARVAAAIEILDDMAEGLAAEQALTRWARRSRFAGSKDRAAIRDHVFDVLRSKRRATHFGQGHTGRALMIGALHLQGAPLQDLFNAQGHAPSPLSYDELMFPAPSEVQAVNWDLPDWLMAEFTASLDTKAEQTATALQQRAPVFLRVNTARTGRTEAISLLAEDDVTALPNPLTNAALTVTEGARRIRNSTAYLEGLVELQDAASQAVVAALPSGGRVLDFCAGGGGKALALAMDTKRQVFAHDISPKRMADLPSRAARAQVEIQQVSHEDLSANGLYDVVLCDAPCSGSGAWRRAAEGKWRLTPQGLKDLTDTQDAILDQAAALVAPDGTLAYATCSVLHVENEARVAAFLARHPGWHKTYTHQYDVCPDGDGFFTAHLRRDKT